MTKIPEHYVLIIQAPVGGTGQGTKYHASLWLDLEQDQTKEQAERQAGLQAGTGLGLTWNTSSVNAQLENPVFSIKRSNSDEEKDTSEQTTL